MVKLKAFLKVHSPHIVLALIVLALASIPYFEVYFTTRDVWRGIPPSFSDDLYFAKVHSIADGHLSVGNPYFLERADGPPLVFFGGAWINALPFAMFSLITAQTINLIVWSFLFTLAVWTLLRALRAPPWLAVFGTSFLYLQSWFHIWRPVNLQPVWPFYFLFYLALLRFIREPNRKNVLLLGVATGIPFYLYAYLWQTIVITLGLLVLYALLRRNWPLVKAALAASLIGGVIGLPVPLYILWLSRTFPYFWESMGRLGLVNSYIPMGEVLRSGGWVGFVLFFVGTLLWCIRSLREDKEFLQLSLFLALSGFGLWITQGSNLITGKLLETGEHLAGLIYPWLVYAGIALTIALWQRRKTLSTGVRTYALAALTLLWLTNVHFVNLVGLVTPQLDSKIWRDEQSYAGPITWLNTYTKSAVVWVEPRDYLSTLLPIFTKDFVLYSNWGMFELVPDSEIRERYLVSQYFNRPTAASLASTTELFNYLGRKDAAHEAKTIERGIKLCRVLFFWDSKKDCGTIPTPQSLLGDAFFANLSKRFTTDIQPNVKQYLAKYHVNYILKDKTLDQSYKPEQLGAVRVYADERYEIWSL